MLAGPLCTMLLGDLGADVLKVERPGSGDDTRGWGPPFVAGESAYYLAFNRNKRSLTLDLASDRGRALLRGLVTRCDVVVDNFKVGQLDRWGLTDEWFDANAPAVVRCSVTGYGTSGPLADRAGYDFILQAETGLMAITGDADGEPMKVGVAVVDLATGLLAAISVLAALAARERTGRGQRTDVSLFDTGLMLLGNVAASYLATGAPAGRFGNGHPNIVPYRSFRAADGDLAVGVGNDEQFRRLAELLGHPEWAADERFATNRARVEHREEIDALVGRALEARPRDEWLAALERAGIPAGRVNEVDEALTNEHAVARDAVVSVPHPLADALRVPGTPLRLDATPAAVRRHPPLLGEHTAEVLGELLGLDAADVAALAADGVV